MTAVIRAMAIVVFFGAVFLTYYQSTDTTEMAWWGQQFPFVSFIVTALVLFLGIAFGCLFRQISSIQGKVAILSEVRNIFSSTSFWAALCVSPFVFFSVYAVISAAPGDPASYLLAFQNGFFCEAVFKQLMTAGGKAAAPQTATQAATQAQPQGPN